MSKFWKNILCLFSTCVLCSSAGADDLDLISRAYLSNKKYAKDIEVQAYLITKDQVANLFSEKNGKIVQKTNKELYDDEVFLLVRVKNKGELLSFGLLNCTIPNRGVPITLDIARMPGSMQSFHDSVLYVGDESIPII